MLTRIIELSVRHRLFVLLIIMALIVSIILKRTPFGIACAMIGSNIEATRYSSIDTRRELVGELAAAGFRVRELVPVSTRTDGRLAAPWFLPALRAYGFLAAAE